MVHIIYMGGFSTGITSLILPSTYKFFSLPIKYAVKKIIVSVGSEQYFVL